MDASIFTKKCPGHLVGIARNLKAYVPDKLPPKLEWTSRMVESLSNAERAIGQLRGLGMNLSNAHLLINPFLRKEAEMSSMIEGTLASMEQLYLFETGDLSVERSVSDVREVHNYVVAMEQGLEMSKKLPICLRMIRQLHQILLKDVRGENKMPGEFRKTQNWIGFHGRPIDQALFIPPPPARMIICLDELERFINEPMNNMPVLAWIAMIHYQFEAIHPFIDGNGRIGRLLITLLMCVKDVLDKPILYLSEYFERNRREYYDSLLRVSTNGQWNEWILFFLQGIAEQSLGASEKAKQLISLQKHYHSQTAGTRSPLLHKLIDGLFETPAIRISETAKRYSVTYAAVKKNVDGLVAGGILKQAAGGKRNKIYIASEILDIINKASAQRTG